MQSDRDFFECTEQIGDMLASNVVSCHSINQLMPPQQQTISQSPQQSQITLQKLYQILQTAYSQLKDSQFMNAIRLMNTYWKHATSPEVNWKLRLCYYLNMACAYQGVWNLQMCDSTCQATQIEINSVVAGLYNVEEKIKLQLILLILRMQHCAIYSQMGAHEKALTTAQQNLQGLKQCLGNILMLTTEGDENKSQRSKSEYGTVSFKSKTKRYLQLLKTLIHDISTPITVQQYGKRPIFYNWKNNPDTNQKFIRHSFAGKHILTKDQQSRSILGLQQDDNTWISEFNIGSIMHMSPFSYQQMDSTPSIYEETQKKKLYEKVIYASVLNFTIATEMRFIDSQNSESTISSMKLKSDSCYRSKMSQLSELHHLKAIELMCKGISHKSPYLNHLINSYHKHYVQALVCINEEDSMMSDMRSRVQSRDRDIQGISVKNQQDYYKVSIIGDVLTEPITTPIPNMKKIKQIKSNEFDRGASKSLQMKRSKKQRENSLRNVKGVEFKSPSSKGFKGMKKTKQPLKINIIKKAMKDNKDCQLRMTTKSETEIKLIMNSKKK